MKKEFEPTPSPILSKFGRATLLRFYKVYGKLPTTRAEVLEFLKQEKKKGRGERLI